MSLEDCCRLCLKNLRDIQLDEDGHFSLADDPNLQRMVLECFQIQVSDEEIISQICSKCNDELRLVDKIRKRVRRTDFEIKQYYASLVIKEEAEFDEESLSDVRENIESELIETDNDELDEKPDFLESFEADDSADNDNFSQKYEFIEVEPIFDPDKTIAEEVTEIVRQNKRTRTEATKPRKKKNVPNVDDNLKVGNSMNTCYICETEFDSFELLNTHLATHIGTSSQKCHLCDLPVTTVRYLNMHLRTIHFRRGKRIPCEECKKNNTVREFSSNFKLQAHIKSFHEGIVEVPEKKHVCTYCGKAFSRGTHLRMHENTHTKAVLYKCEQCKFAAVSKSGLLRHLRIHTAEKPFKCDECDASFNQSNALHSHKMSKHSDERPFGCEICGDTKRFKTKYILQHHMRMHEKADSDSFAKGRRVRTLGTEITVYDPELKCSFCPAVYRKEVFLCRHMIEKHPLESVPMIPCDICNATNKNVYFLTQNEKDRHAHNHEKIKPVPDKERVCADCGKVFHTNTSYHHHRQTHMSTVCKECGKSFSTSRTLRLHVLTVHLKSRPYKCDKCDSSFGQLTSLNAHMKVHQK